MIPYVLGVLTWVITLSAMMLFAHFGLVPRDDVLACTAMALAVAATIRGFQREFKHND
mgnify:FL=1|jgi:hypothetical protein|tara:strand:- start:51 stop:224 length:174 start_codon:yes stop_codon:yes gene_type:complete